MKNAQRSFALLPLIVACAVLEACQGTQGHDRATETAATMAELRKAIVTTKDAITPVSASLTELLKDTADAAPAYKSFVSSSDKLADATKRTQDILASLRDQGTAYFAEWEKQNAAITDADIKESSDERRKKLKKQLDELTKSMGKVAESYPPYLARIKDARTFLSNDLTKAGIKSIDSTLSHLINEGGDVSKELDEVVKEIDETMPAFQAAKPPPPPAK